MEIDLAFLVESLRRQARLIALVLAGGLIVTFLGLLIIGPRYIATASLYIEAHPQKVFNAEAVQPDLNSDVVIESELEVLRSRRLASRVLSELQRKDAAPAGDDSGSRTSWWWPRLWSAEPTGVQVADASLGTAPAKEATDAAPPATEAPPSTDKVEKFLSGLSVDRKGRSYVVEVSYTDVSGERASKIANAIADTYVADQLEGKLQATRQANLGLKERVGEIRQELKDIEQQQQKFRADRELVEVGDLSLMQREIADYAMQLVSARAHAAEAEARLNQVRSMAGDPQQLLSLDIALQSNVISDYRRQSAEIQRRIGDNVSHFGEQHPTVISAKAELDNLNGEIEREIKRIVESQKLAYEAATGKVKLLEDGLQNLKQNHLKFGDDQRKLGEFKREIEVSSNDFTNFLRRYNETKAQEKMQTADAHVVSYAVTPSRPSSPKKGLILLLASVGWLGVGMGLGLAREITNRSLRTRAEVERALGVPCVATVPVVDPTLDGAEKGAQHNLCGPIHWRVDEETDGGFSQAIFTLKQWIGAIGPPGPRVVLLAAAHPAEGCSTIAAQLVRYATSTGARAVLVDADLRTRGMTQALGVDAKTTFADGVLNDAKSKSAVVHLKDHGMHLCPAPGRGDKRPLDVLGSRHMLGFFDALRDEYDLIVVDTPPMSTYVDASALIEYADCVLVVVKARQTQQNDVLDVLHRLDVDPRLAIGVVLNMVDRAARE